MSFVRNIYFQDDLTEYLKKEENVSGLINELLRKHFNSTDINKMDKEQLENWIAIKKAKIEYEKKMEEINERIDNR